MQVEGTGGGRGRKVGREAGHETAHESKLEDEMKGDCRCTLRACGCIPARETKGIGGQLLIAALARELCH